VGGRSRTQQNTESRVCLDGDEVTGGRYPAEKKGGRGGRKKENCQDWTPGELVSLPKPYNREKERPRGEEPRGDSPCTRLVKSPLHDAGKKKKTLRGKGIAARTKGEGKKPRLVLGDGTREGRIVGRPGRKGRAVSTTAVKKKKKLPHSGRPCCWKGKGAKKRGPIPPRGNENRLGGSSGGGEAFLIPTGAGGEPPGPTAGQ